MGVGAAVIVLHKVLWVLLSCCMVPGPGGPSRERVAVYVGKKNLAAKEEVSKQKKNEREMRNHTSSEAGM